MSLRIKRNDILTGELPCYELNLFQLGSNVAPRIKGLNQQKNRYHSKLLGTIDTSYLVNLFFYCVAHSIYIFKLVLVSCQKILSSSKYLSSSCCAPTTTMLAEWTLVDLRLPSTLIWPIRTFELNTVQARNKRRIMETRKKSAIKSISPMQNTNNVFCGTWPCPTK